MSYILKETIIVTDDLAARLAHADAIEAFADATPAGDLDALALWASLFGIQGVSDEA